MPFRPYLREFYGEFIAADPWNKGEEVLWSLEGFQMLSSRTRVIRAKGQPEVPPKGRFNGPPKTQPGADRFPGIRSTLYDRYRILPLGVYDLYKEGKVQPVDLPWVLHAIEAQLHTSDYPPAFASIYLGTITGIFLFFAVFSAALYYYLTSAQMAPPAPWFLWLPTMCAVLGMASIIGLQYVKMRRKTVRQRALDLLTQRKSL